MAVSVPEARTRRVRSWGDACRRLVAAAIVMFPFYGQPSEAEDGASLKNHILGLGTCPPWNPQSVEICRYSVDKVMSSLAPRLDAGPDRQHLLVNEGASAAALKLKATELANKLGPEDRLVIYANLPLGVVEQTGTGDQTNYALELWASAKPDTTLQAISDGTWMSASAFAALIHAIPAGEVILILDTNNPQAFDLGLLEHHAVDNKNRPEALVISSGPGQSANYSADRTISLFGKHLAVALHAGEGTLQDIVTTAVNGTRQAAIPICAELKEKRGETTEPQPDCTQVPEIHDPDALLNRTVLLPLSESNVN